MYWKIWFRYSCSKNYWFPPQPPLFSRQSGSVTVRSHKHWRRAKAFSCKSIPFYYLLIKIISVLKVENSSQKRNTTHRKKAMRKQAVYVCYFIHLESFYMLCASRYNLLKWTSSVIMHICIFGEKSCSFSHQAKTEVIRYDFVKDITNVTKKVQKSHMH